MVFSIHNFKNIGRQVGVSLAGGSAQEPGWAAPTGHYGHARSSGDSIPRSGEIQSNRNYVDKKNRKIEPSGLCFEAILGKGQNINYIQVQATLLPWYEKELGVRRFGQEEGRQSAQGRKQG